MSIKSIFEDNGVKRIREFQFSIDREVYDEAEIKNAPEGLSTGTAVTLKKMNDFYRDGWPRDTAAIAQRIVDHFLIRLAAGSCPSIKLYDNSIKPIDLYSLFKETIQPHIEEIPFEIGSNRFSLQVFRHKGSRDKHELNFCALGRGVMRSKLRDLLPELPERFLDSTDGKPYTLKVLVTGKYFDDNSNTQRTDILFNPDTDDLMPAEDLLKRREIDAKVVEVLRKSLLKDLKITNEEKLQNITKFIEKAPEYRVLLNDRYREKLEQKIPPGITEEKLDEHLLHLRREIEDDVRNEGRAISKLVDIETFDEYRNKMRQLIERMNEVGKSQLASYIAHRRAILDLLDLSLKKSRADKKYRFEEVLHNMIFPMGCTSKDLFLEQQNLWVVDERLTFHTILTSDKRISSISGMESTSRKEPDVFAFFYDTPIGVREPVDSSGAIVIIEFKRPGRDDYRNDPAQQVIQRFIEIKNGRIKDIDGRPINSAHLRYFGYLIADFTASLRSQMEMNYHPSIDGEGFFKTLSGGNGYIEIISYDKLLKDAKQRNRALFEKLGLHKN